MGSANRVNGYVLALLICLAGPTVAAADVSRDGTTEYRWRELFQRKPYPYTKPLAAEKPTAIDGEYVKTISDLTPPIPCRRCPDYKPEGGLWKLSLRKGVFRIFHAPSGWRSIGSFFIEGVRILLVNDPVCPGLTGSYRWRLNNDTITFSAVEDRCSAGLRARNISRLPWEACHPGSRGAAASGHWSKPDGCDQR